MEGGGASQDGIQQWKEDELVRCRKKEEEGSQDGIKPNNEEELVRTGCNKS